MRLTIVAAAALVLGSLVPATALAQGADSQVEAGINAYTRDGNRVAARAAFLKAINLDARQAPARFNLAMMAEDEENWGEAIRYYSEYAGLVSADDLYLGVARRKIAALRKFAELDSTPEGKAERIYLQLVQRAQSKLTGGDQGAGLALAELATQRRADRFEGHLIKGVALMELERYADAQAALDRARSLAGGDSQAGIDALAQKARKLSAAKAKVSTGDAAFEARNYAAAADAYGQAWTVADQPEFGIQAARSWSLAGEPLKSLKIYDVLVRSNDPGTAAIAREERNRVSLLALDAGSAAPLQRPEYARAREFITSGKFYEADAQLTLVLDGLMPDRGYAALYEARGVARLGLRENIGAVADFTVALLLDPSRAAIYERRAGAYAALSRFLEAASDIGAAMERSPASDRERLRALRAGYAARAGK
jgi:hypothetical protein